MALTHAAPGTAVALRTAYVPGEPKAQALFKSRDLEVVRLALAAGEALPPHRVAGEISVQCLSGALRLGLDEGHCALRAGEMSYLSGGALHDVRALEDCVALVTIVLAHG